MTKADEDKIAKLELDTVKAVTEMRGDIKSLTNIINDLKNSINRMTENYVTKEEHLKDITDLKTQLSEAKRVGRSRSILTGILVAIFTTVITYEAMKLIK